MPEACGTTGMPEACLPRRPTRTDGLRRGEGGVATVCVEHGAASYAALAIDSHPRFFGDTRTSMGGVRSLLILVSSSNEYSPTGLP